MARARLHGMVVVLAGFAAMGFAGWRWTSARQRTALVEIGTKTTGEVTGLRQGGRRNRSNYVTYRFQAGPRTVTAVDCELYTSDWAALRPGATIDVWYDPANPEVCISAPERSYATSGTAISSGIIAVIGLILAAGGAARIFGRPA